MKNDKKNLFVLGIIISIIITIVFSTITVMAIMNGKQRSRTIMIYMVGSNLESQAGLATADLNSINNISNQYTRVLLIAGGSRKWKNDYINSEETSIYELTNSGFKKVKDQPKQNMGAQETFSNFLSFAYDYSKSDEYDLIFWNHGGAIDGSEYDELNSNDNLSLAEMETSLQGSPFSKKKLEVVIFRTCLNGTIEVDSTFSNYAKYLVASEEVTLGASNTSVLNFINELSPKDSAQDVGKKFINSYKRQINDLKSYTTLSSDDSIYSTYSLINLSNVDKLNKSVERSI